MSEQPQRQSWELTVRDSAIGSAVDFLAQQTGISKGRLKDAMIKGAVWLQRGRGARKRLRRATAKLQTGDILLLHYDPELLARTPPVAKQLWRCKEYSVWYKPPGLLAQGNEYGDHASLLRQAELADPLRKPVFLIHRLDREAQGLMLIAHTQTAARHLSQLFQRQQVSKFYQVQVVGKPETDSGSITQALDGKPALTHYELVRFDAEANISLLSVQIKTGRTHQIRRHFEMLGHPVIGDPKYGRGNKSDAGLQLEANRLAFECPITHEQREFVLSELLDKDKNCN